MDISIMGIVAFPAIIILCYAVGVGAKASTLDNKYIPVVVMAVGAVLGVIGMMISPSFPAKDVLTAAAVGVVSGLASTGVNQLLKQMKKG